MRILALGDSYTCGEGVAVAERWPNQLARMLRERAIDVHDPELIATTAWTTDELSDAIDAANPKGPYDLVTLLVGVNDQYRSRPVAPFAAEFKRLLRRAKTLAGNKARQVLVLSIPDWGATPYADGRDRAAIAKEIESFNTAARALTEAARIRWIDITTITREMQRNPELVAQDRLHPSGEMYRRWAEMLLPLVAPKR